MPGLKSKQNMKEKRIQVIRRQSINISIRRGGPPAHAKAHGYRAKHQYRYYPIVQKVYHDSERGLYFYLKVITGRLVHHYHLI